jgi:hypothetical protein
MKQPDLPRFNPNLRTFADKQAELKYTFQRDRARKRRIRNQRLGDIALGGLFMLVGFITVQMIAGVGR